MKPLVNEGDVLLFLEPNRQKDTVYFVDKTEDLVYDYTSFAAVNTLALGSFTQIDNLEPRQITTDESEIQVYQIRAGIDVGMCYVEMLAGTIRRTPFKARRPTTRAPYTGYFDENDSDFRHGRYEFFLRYNEKPSFAVFNRWGFQISPKMSFRGRKLRCFDCDKPQQTALATGLNPARISQMAADARNDTGPHRRITVYGMED